MTYLIEEGVFHTDRTIFAFHAGVIMDRIANINCLSDYYTGCKNKDIRYRSQK